MVTTMSPRTCERRWGTPRPRSVCSVPDWVPGLISRSTHSSMSESASATSASSRGSWIVVPSAAAVIGTRDVAAQVGAVAGEDRVRRDVDLDVQVTGRTAAGADLALVGELDAGAGVDAGRDLDRDRAARAHPAVAGALAARVGDDLAVAAAGVARPQRADLAEERALHVLHLAAAVAGLAGDRARALGGAAAVADGAQDRGVDLELAGDAEGGLGELDLEPDQRVLSAAGARTRAAALARRPGRRRTRP